MGRLLWTVVFGVVMLCLVTTSIAAPSKTVIELRRHLLDADINALTFHSIDSMFEVLPVANGKGAPTKLPEQRAPLDFTYRFDGQDIAAEDFLEHTYTNALLSSAMIGSSSSDTSTRPIRTLTFCRCQWRNRLPPF